MAENSPPKQSGGINREAMALTRRKIFPDVLANESLPVQYVTENGFSIIRLCDVDNSVTATPRECGFLVRNDRGWEREITVAFAESLVAQIQSRRRIPLSNSSVLWVVCAEQRLATYLWENDDYPEGGELIISELPIDDLLLATHWNDQRDD